MGGRLFIIRGNSASGKSTIAKKTAAGVRIWHHAYSAGRHTAGDSSG